MHKLDGFIRDWNIQHTIGIAHFLLPLAHKDEISHNGVGKILQTLKINFQGLQLGGLPNLFWSKAMKSHLGDKKMRLL